MEEKQFTEAFHKFMPKSHAEALAQALCTKCDNNAVKVIDDESCTIGCEDGSSFGDDGQCLPGVSISKAERGLRQLHGQKPPITSLGWDMFYSAWMHAMTESILGRHNDAWLYAVVRDDESDYSYCELAMAICAIRKAFPDDAARLITEHVKQNHVCGLF